MKKNTTNVGVPRSNFQYTYTHIRVNIRTYFPHKVISLGGNQCGTDRWAKKGITALAPMSSNWGIAMAEPFFRLISLENATERTTRHISLFATHLHEKLD